MTSRQAAYLSIVSLEKKGRYSNLEVDSNISKYSLEGKERALYTNLVYGVTERKLTLEYFLSELSDIKKEKLDPDVKAAVLLGLYQIFYLSNTPDFAAVNESVELVKWAYNVKDTSSKFVNAVLREAIRKKDTLLKFGNIKDKTKLLSVKYSVSEFLASKLSEQYTESEVIRILENSFCHPYISIRTNTLKISTAELCELLNSKGIHCKESSLCQDAIILTENVPYEMLSEFEQYFFVQDISSQICCKVFSPEENEIILDACACPGGKSFHSAMIMKNKGNIVSRDLHKNKLSLVTKGASKLGINIIKCEEGSSAEPLGYTYDKILCDVPCSGFGVISKKPEIRYKNESDVSNLPSVQYSILDNCAKYVKNGGILQYSTCTILKEENEDIINRFLENHKDFEPSYFEFENEKTYMKQILPDGNRDGFFIGRLIRRKEQV